MQNSISLVEIVDRINEMEQQGEFICESMRHITAQTILKFYDGNNKYLGFYLPMIDFKRGGRLFSGERLYTQLGINTIISLELSRALAILATDQPAVKSTLEEVENRLRSKCYVKDGCFSGECAFNMVAFWRYLLVCEWQDRDVRIKSFLQLLKNNRDGSGRWKHFPFYYTLMVLLETRNYDARLELDYALPACEASFPYISLGEPYRQRRKAILERCLQLASIPEMSYLPLGV
jgi:hypothetical protein